MVEHAHSVALICISIIMPLPYFVDLFYLFLMHMFSSPYYLNPGHVTLGGILHCVKACRVGVSDLGKGIRV